MISLLSPFFARGKSRLLPSFDPIGLLAAFSLGSWGYIAVGVGTAVGGYLSKPKAPKMAEVKPVDPQEEQRKAIQGNLDNADDIESLITRANAFTQKEANSLMETAMPGYSKIAEKFMQQADGMLTDPYSLPKDFGDNLTRIASERGISTGVRGQAGDFSLLRDFGVNSLQFGQNRISQAQSILQTIGNLAPRVNPMSPVSFYITPKDQMNATASNNASQTSAQQAKNNADAAARNQTASMWGGVVSNISGMAGGALMANGTDGTGDPTTYDQFLIDNPNSSAAQGNQPIKFVDENWSL